MKHISIVSPSLVLSLCLIYLFLLNSIQRIFCSWVSTPCALGWRYQIMSASRLYVSSCWHSITKPLWIEIICSIVHLILIPFVFEPSAHQLVFPLPPTCLILESITPVIWAVDTFLVYYCHAIKIIMSQVEVLPCLVLQLTPLVVVVWQLLYLKAALFVYLLLKGRRVIIDVGVSTLIVFVACEGNLLMILLRRYFCLIRHVEIVNVLRVIHVIY